MKDPVIGERFVPIIPDEARTFGMDSLFPTAKIYSPFGQTYEGVDRNLMLAYKESERGQMLHEGISEAGAMGSVIAAGSSYATHGTHMIPVYVFYSMFGWQRTGDQMWAPRRPDGARVPARGHGRPHHADRRGAAAQRRALAAARLRLRGVRVLRPGVGLRDRGDHQGRAAPDVRRVAGAPGRREHLLLPHRLQRAVPRSRPRPPPTASRRASCAACTGTRRRRLRRGRRGRSCSPRASRCRGR